jgi:hypothetical protein
MSISIPAFHVSDQSEVKGAGDVFIASRASGAISGIFTVRVAAHFNPADPYPVGTLTIKVDLADGANGVFTATSIDLINSYGKANPTVYVTGRCNGDLSGVGAEVPKGLRYWLMIADNGRDAASREGTPDIVGFAIHDRNGAQVAYGTGPLKSGDFKVTPK